MNLKKTFIASSVIAATATVVVAPSTLNNQSNNQNNNQSNNQILNVKTKVNVNYVILNNQVREGINKARLNLNQTQLGNDVAFVFEDGQNYIHLPGIRIYGKNSDKYKDDSIIISTENRGKACTGGILYTTGRDEKGNYIKPFVYNDGQIYNYGKQTFTINVLYGPNIVKTMKSQVNVIPLTYYVQTVAVPSLKVGESYKYYANGHIAGTVTVKEGTGKYNNEPVIQICSNKNANITIVNGNNNLHIKANLAENVANNNIEYTKKVLPTSFSNSSNLPWATIESPYVSFNTKPTIIDKITTTTIKVEDGTKDIGKTETASGNPGIKTGLKTPNIPAGYKISNITVNGNVVTSVPETFGHENQNIVYHIAKLSDQTISQEIKTESGLVLSPTKVIATGYNGEHEDIKTPKIPNGYKLTGVEIGGKTISKQVNGKLEYKLPNEIGSANEKITYIVKELPTTTTIKVEDGTKDIGKTETASGNPGIKTGLKTPNIPAGYKISKITVNGNVVTSVPETFGHENQNIVYHITKLNNKKVEVPTDHKASGNHEKPEVPAGNKPSGNHEKPEVPAGNKPSGNHEKPEVPASNKPSGNHEKPEIPAGNKPSGNHEKPETPASNKPSGNHEKPKVPAGNKSSGNHEKPEIPAGNKTSGNHEKPEVPAGNKPSGNHEKPEVPAGNKPSGNHEKPEIPAGNKTSGNHEKPEVPAGNKPSGNHEKTEVPADNKISGNHEKPEVPAGNKPSGNHEKPEIPVGHEVSKNYKNSEVKVQPMKVVNSNKSKITELPNTGIKNDANEITGVLAGLLGIIGLGFLFKRKK